MLISVARSALGWVSALRSVNLRERFIIMVASKSYCLIRKQIIITKEQDKKIKSPFYCYSLSDFGTEEVLLGQFIEQVECLA